MRRYCRVIYLFCSPRYTSSYKSFQ